MPSLIPRKVDSLKLNIERFIINSILVDNQETIETFVTLYKNGLYSIKFNNHYGIYNIENSKILDQIAYSMESGDKVEIGDNSEYRILHSFHDNVRRGNLLIYSDSKHDNPIKHVRTDSKESNVWSPELDLQLSGSDLQRLTELIKKMARAI